jgi:protein gp37
MGEYSKIEWTDHTFNPWIGCQHVSPGCDHCYAEKMMDHRYGRVEWGPHGQRKRTSEANWRNPVKWDAEAKSFKNEYGHPPRVFCASLADVFDNKVPSAKGYELTVADDRCVIGVNFATQPYCYRPTHWGDRVVFDIESRLNSN